jgi:hypothetical protein
LKFIIYLFIYLDYFRRCCWCRFLWWYINRWCFYFTRSMYCTWFMFIWTRFMCLDTIW